MEIAQPFCWHDDRGQLWWHMAWWEGMDSPPCVCVLCFSLGSGFSAQDHDENCSNVVTNKQAGKQFRSYLPGSYLVDVEMGILRERCLHCSSKCRVEVLARIKANQPHLHPPQVTVDQRPLVHLELAAPLSSSSSS